VQTRFLAITFATWLAACAHAPAVPDSSREDGPVPDAAPLTVASPDGRLVVSFAVAADGPRYRLSRDGRELIGGSAMGFDLVDAAPLGPGMQVVGVSRRALDETWTQPWGE
jgi:alpha-glucosidase